MGMHYARHDGEAEDVAVAWNERCSTALRAGDDLPSNPVACAVAIADQWIPSRVFSVSASIRKVTKTRLRWSLRRWACWCTGQKNLNLDLQTLTEEAVPHGDKLTNAKVVDEVIDFMLSRFRAWYQDEGYTVDTIQAVLARRPTRPADFDAHMKAVSTPYAGRVFRAGCGQQARVEYPREV
ncbi:glycine--tRNA ligase subunit beta [Escherichia coli]